MDTSKLIRYRSKSGKMTYFPSKETGSVSFNLTAQGRQILKEQSLLLGMSQGDYIEALIRQGRIFSIQKDRKTTRKGGAPSFFTGMKTRGTTTAVSITPLAHSMLDEQVAASKMSRGDYLEFLLLETVKTEITQTQELVEA